MLIRRGGRTGSPWVLVGIVVLTTMLLACLIAALALSIISLPDLDGSDTQVSGTATPRPDADTATISVLDVDQGQAVLVVAPDGSAALVDAGRSQTRIREEIVPYAREQGINELQYLILSHPDQDHVGGMPEVFEHFSVENWVDPGIPTTNQRYEETIEIVLEQDIPAILARQGERLTLGDSVELSLLWPQSGFILSGSEPDSNENSVVLKVSFHDVDILIPGDLETRGEDALVEQLGGALEAEILVVGHHGSNTSSTAPFLDAVNPELAIISAGRDNPYGHPHDEVMQRLRFRGVEIYRTDLDGTVEIATDGVSYSVTTVDTDSD
jgi:competence protein ComEC